jgi:8-oxo-dGTP pyrophosphatase MutT (NUDIX family)/GNAT superfamily N-acetyltransferase
VILKRFAGSCPKSNGKNQKMKCLQFGDRESGYDYYSRPGVYGILINEKGEIGVVEVNGLYFLPGGGIEPHEEERDALIREIREETGFEASVNSCLGRANEFQISYDKSMRFNQLGSFYYCSVISDHKDKSDLNHYFMWKKLDEMKTKFARKSHFWAASMALHSFDQFEMQSGGQNVKGYYRLIQEAELTCLLDLYRHLHSIDDQFSDIKRYDNIWDPIVRDPNILYFGAEWQNRIVATCNLSITPNLTRGCRPFGVIENVVTHADFQSKGIGKGILKFALNTAWAFGCYKVMLMTGSSKEWVHKFYIDAGFKINVKTAFLAKT